MRVPLFAARRALPVALTLSGNEITDATRATNTQGDGLSGDSSYGLWEAATNLITNGGVETNTTGWAGYAGATLTRDAAHAKFGTYALKVVTPGSVNNEGTTPTSPGGHIATTTGTTLTGSVWAYSVSGGEVVFADLGEFDAAHGYLRSTAAPLVTLVAGWQRLTVTGTMGASTAYVGFSFRTRASGAAQAITVWLDGLQLEAKPIATPYVHTDGGTATRSAARVQIPASVLNATQGWVALRLRLGWASASGDGYSFPFALDWRNDVNNRIGVYWNQGGGQWGIDSITGGVTTSAFVANSFAAQDCVTVIGAWTAGAVSLSVNGAVFTTTSGGTRPSITATLADILQSAGTGIFFDSSLLWLLCGKGTLTNADAALLHNFGNADPNPRLIPASARLTGLWGANNGIMRTYVA